MGNTEINRGAGLQALREHGLVPFNMLSTLIMLSEDCCDSRIVDCPMKCNLSVEVIQTACLHICMFTNESFQSFFVSAHSAPATPLRLREVHAEQARCAPFMG